MMRSAVLLLALLIYPQVLWAGLPEVVAQLRPSIVLFATFNKLATPALNIRGSGFVVADGNTAVTNSHVVPEVLAEGERVVLFVNQGADYSQREAVLVRRDVEHDLALLRFNGPAVPTVKLSSGSRVADGTEIAISGFPIGNILGITMVTHRGIVAAYTPIAIPQGHASQLNPAAVKRIKRGSFEIYQLDITAYPGSSGSALYLADSGEVVGIVNSGMVKSSKESALTQPTGITYAIPVRFLNELIRGLPPPSPAGN